jgi:hypothetical protein
MTVFYKGSLAIYMTSKSSIGITGFAAKFIAALCMFSHEHFAGFPIRDSLNSYKPLAQTLIGMGPIPARD